MDQGRRRQFLIALGALLAAPLGASAIHAQPAARVHRVGIVSPLPASPEPRQVRAFRQGLAELGYVEGKNVVIETRFAGNRRDRFPELIADLIKLKVDVIVTGSAPGAIAAKRATSTVPIVFAGVIDPVALGIVTSLARPGGNVTGVTYGAGGSAVAGKWLELLKEAIPRMTRVAVLSNPADPGREEYVREIRAAAQTLKVEIKLFDASDDATLEEALAAIGTSGAHGLIVTGSAYFGGNRARLVRYAAEKRIPAIYFFSLFPDAGGLMSYGASLEESYRKAASYVDKILKGMKPADLPVEQPTRFELVVNLRAAKAIGVTVPQSLLVRADRVIE